MEPSFNILEQRVLRFLKEEFLKKGSAPATMRDPATMERDVMDVCDISPIQYREIMARLEHHGIAKPIAIGSKNGHVQISPMIIGVVRQLDETNALCKPRNVQPDRVEQIKQYFFSKKWFAFVVIVACVVGAVALFLSNLDTIKTWSGNGLAVNWCYGTGHA